jgi:NADPH:quinone reductase-like Zn-dependent oxidoreductase
MRALLFRETGDPKEVLHLEEIADPTPGEGEVLLRVLFSPVNPSDLHMVRGRYGYQPELPASPGGEGVGLIEAIGPGVQGLLVGTRVLCIGTWNLWREKLVCKATQVLEVPDQISSETAATCYTNPLTAWALTQSSHQLKQGDWLLQTAAASSVGRLVLQLAKIYGFRTINVVRKREQEQVIRVYGGDEVICTADEDLRSRIQEITNGRGIERAIDCVAGELGAEIVRNLAPAGTMLQYGALSSHRQTDPRKFQMPIFSPQLIYSAATVRGWWIPRWVDSQPIESVRQYMKDLLGFVARGTLTIPETRSIPMSRYSEAIAAADGGDAGGRKLLIDFSA